MLLQEGIKALKNGDSQAVMTNLDAAKQAMVPGEVMNHFEQGMKALENGDLNGAIMHLTAAGSNSIEDLKRQKNLILQILFFNFLQDER